MSEGLSREYKQVDVKIRVSARCPYCLKIVVFWVSWEDSPIPFSKLVSMLDTNHIMVDKCILAKDDHDQ